jgi:flagellar biosynthesis protein FliQ
MSRHPLYSLQLLDHAMFALASAVSPVIFGILLVGLLLAVVQGALQVEEGALAMAAKLVVVIALATGAIEMAFHSLEHLARTWMMDAPRLIDHDWS